MAYYNGTANSLTALRQALIDACVGEGWVWDSGNEVLSKAGLFVRITASSSSLFLLGRTGPTGGDAPGTVRIGRLFQQGTLPTYDLTFPAGYELFLFEQEVYLVVNYAVDHYQWLAFGRSTVATLPGTGMWLGASASSSIVGTEGPMQNGPVYITATGGGDEGNAASNAAALFWGKGGTSYATARNAWLHSDLDGEGWQLSNGDYGSPVGISPLVPLIGLLPNAWNSEAVLLPIRAYKLRPENRISLTADLEHARHTRIDHYVPGQVITIGSDRWKVFPWFRKDVVNRNGGYGIHHSGTFGWAIRYEGP